MIFRARPLAIVLLVVAAVGAIAIAVGGASLGGSTPVAVLPSGGSVLASTSAAPTPTPTPTPVPVLRPDGMATVASSGELRVWSLPGGAKAKAVKPLLAVGAVVYLVTGPRRSAGTDWWEVQAEYAPHGGGQFGWIHATGAAGLPTLVPFAPECPSSDGPIDQARMVALGTLRSLACFGGREITVRGDLACYDATVDWAVGGASWMGPNYSCSLNQAFYLEGSAIANLNGGRRPVFGYYDIRGHFDDPESSGCGPIPLGAFTQTPFEHPDPWAVMACRQDFVVTEATEVPR